MSNVVNFPQHICTLAEIRVAERRDEELRAAGFKPARREFNTYPGQEG